MKATARCAATTKGGAACLNRAMFGSPYCHGHAPDRAEERVRIARQGGQGVRAWG
jgi:hypothetical protein